MTDLAFYAPSNFKCGLLNGDLIQHGIKRFLVTVWNYKYMYTIEFTDVSENQIPPFYKNPAYVKELVETNKIKVIERKIQ